MENIPHELLPMMLGVFPTLKIAHIAYPTQAHVEWLSAMKVFNPKHYIVTITGLIIYVDHFASFEITFTSTGNISLAAALKKNIDDFLNKINNGIPSSVCLTHWNTNIVENTKDPTNIPRTMYNTNPKTIISYQGDKYKINDIILAKDSHELICDLLKTVRSNIYLPDHLDYVEKTE